MIKKAIIASLLFSIIPTLAQAEDILIYSYSKTSQNPAEWAIIPMIADVPDTTPVSLFDALRRKKLPTYGSTTYETTKKQVLIDETKCAYGSIISAEIGQTFQAHGHAQPKFVCAGKTISPAISALPHFAAIIPLWQAIASEKIDEPAIIDIGDEYLSITDFQTRLKKQDKGLIKATESAFEDPNLFVKSGAMKGYIMRKFPNAEKRIAKELSSSSSGNVSAAMAALANTKDTVIISQMKTILQKKEAQQEAYALSMLDSSSSELRDESLVILLSSANEANFTKAISATISGKRYELVKQHSDEILTASTPSHAEKLAEMLIAQNGELQIEQWLAKADATETAQTVAAKSLSSAKTSSLKLTALSMQLTHSSPDTAFDALDALLSDTTAVTHSEYWQRGLNSPHIGIYYASFDKLDELGQISAQSEKGKTYIEEAKSNPLEVIPKLTSDAYHSDVKVRQDIAYTAKWLDNAGDSLRSILIKDSEESVASLVMIETAQRPAQEISLSLVKEMTARAEQSTKVRVALLHAIPRMMNEKTTQTIATYASNEMFDNDISVKIASIRALSEIAQRTKDPVIADNAITSLALTAQDKSKSIVHHTLRALERTGLPAAQEILDKFNK